VRTANHIIWRDPKAKKVRADAASVAANTDTYLLSRTFNSSLSHLNRPTILSGSNKLWRLHACNMVLNSICYRLETIISFYGILHLFSYFPLSFQEGYLKIFPMSWSRVLESPSCWPWSCLFGLLVRSSLSSAPGVALPVCQTRVPWSFYRMVQYPLSGYSQSLGSCSQHVRAWMHGIMGTCIKVGCQANWIHLNHRATCESTHTANDTAVLEQNWLKHGQGLMTLSHLRGRAFPWAAVATREVNLAD